jgi:hypothetical protein
MVTDGKIFLCTGALMFLAATLINHASGADKSSFSHAQICKAGIGVVMGRDPKTIKVDRAQSDAIYFSYVRADDGKRWAYKCKIEGDKIIWGADDGRWRTHPDDSVITFNVRASTLTVVERYGDGSSNRKNFIAQQLGR